MMKSIITRIFLTLTLLTILTPVGIASAQKSDDDIAGEFKITITPEDTGYMIIKYEFLKYCAGIDYPDGPYRTGVPRRNFEVLDWGSSTGVVTEAKPLISGSEFQVALTLGHKPKKGECWDMFFSIRQKEMAYDFGEEGISMQFLNPYWKDDEDFFFAKKFTVIWNYGDKDPTKFDPEPDSNQNGEATYTWENVRLNKQFAVQTIWFPRDAFPNLDAANVRDKSEVFTGGGVPAATTDTQTEDLPWVQLCCACLFILFVILLIWYIFWASDRVSRRRRTTWHGTSTSSTSINPAIFLSEAAETVANSLPDVEGGSYKSGGGGGGGGCACACAGCACACAGGGR